MISFDQKRDALERLLHSQTFARADQLRRFIRFVCEAEMSGRSEEISEHTIATQALGRHPDYVPGDDSSVRNRAHALRLKLEEYYRSEEPGAAVRIELRKGTYVPAFIERQAAVAAPVAPAAAPLVEPPRAMPPQPVGAKRWPMFGMFLAGAAAAAVVTGSAWWWASRQAGPDPVVKAAWGKMLEPGTEVTVCVASPPTLLLKSFREGTLPAQPLLMEPPAAVQQWYAGLNMLDGGGKLYMLTTMNSTLFGDSLAAVKAMGMLTAARAKAHVIPEWGTRPLALRGRNLLLIGSPNYSPLAARILQKMPLTVWYDPVRKEEVIAEDLADGKARRVFQPKRDAYGSYSAVYGLLTVLPSHAPLDSQEVTAIFSGITSAGPQAAMEVFASPQHLRELLGRMGRSRLPSSYQVVVRAGVDRSLALNWGYEHHRVIEQAPAVD